MLTSLHKHGLEALKNKNYTEATNFFTESINNNPLLAESYFYLGKCYFLRDLKNEAIETLEKFVRLTLLNKNEKENLSYALDLLGQCYASLKMDKKALNCYNIAIENNPNCDSAWHNKGLLYLASAMESLDTDLTESDHFFYEAQICINKAVELCAYNPLFLHSLASWYENYIEVLKKHIEDSDAAHEHIDKNFLASINLYQQSLSMCQEQDLALKNIISSNLSECLAQYGHHYYKKGDYKKALEIYQDSLDYAPNHLVVINQIGMCHFKFESYSEARKHFSSIIDKTTDNQEIADAWLNIACAYRHEKSFHQAQEALDKAKQLAPDDEYIIDEQSELNTAKRATLTTVINQTIFRNTDVYDQVTIDYEKNLENQEKQISHFGV